MPNFAVFSLACVEDPVGENLDGRGFAVFTIPGRYLCRATVAGEFSCLRCGFIAMPLCVESER